MDDPVGHDYMDIATPQLQHPDRGAGALSGPILFVAVALACVAGVYYAANRFFSRRTATAATVGDVATADDLTKRQLTAFIDRFLPAYYNYSYILYGQSVDRAETMMTPDFQAAYNQRSEDLDFKRKLDALKVSTDGIKILPGSLAFSNDGDRYYVRLAGTMTFTTGINGVSGDFPLTLLLAVQKTADGFLVDNVERLR